MTRTKKGILLSLLGILEIVFLSLGLATNRPRRAAELAAFARYQQVQTSENRDQRLREQPISDREVNLRETLGNSLCIANLFLIAFVISKTRNDT
jgi:hypothetical protein